MPPDVPSFTSTLSAPVAWMLQWLITLRSDRSGSAGDDQAPLHCHVDALSVAGSVRPVSCTRCDRPGCSAALADSQPLVAVSATVNPGTPSVGVLYQQALLRVAHGESDQPHATGVVYPERVVRVVGAPTNTTSGPPSTVTPDLCRSTGPYRPRVDLRPSPGALAERASDPAGRPHRLVGAGSVATDWHRRRQTRWRPSVAARRRDGLTVVGSPWSGSTSPASASTVDRAGRRVVCCGRRSGRDSTVRSACSLVRTHERGTHRRWARPNDHVAVPRSWIDTCHSTVAVQEPSTRCGGPHVRLPSAAGRAFLRRGRLFSPARRARCCAGDWVARFRGGRLQPPVPSGVVSACPSLSFPGQWSAPSNMPGRTQPSRRSQQSEVSHIPPASDARTAVGSVDPGLGHPTTSQNDTVEQHQLWSAP